LSIIENVIYFGNYTQTQTQTQTTTESDTVYWMRTAWK